MVVGGVDIEGGGPVAAAGTVCREAGELPRKTTILVDRLKEALADQVPNIFLLAPKPGLGDLKDSSMIWVCQGMSQDIHRLNMHRYHGQITIGNHRERWLDRQVDGKTETHRRIGYINS